MNPLNSVAGAITTGFIAAILVIIIVVALGGSPGSFYELGLARWLHIISGITWIGLLYYFNLVQTPGLARRRPIRAVQAGRASRSTSHRVRFFGFAGPRLRPG